MKRIFFVLLLCAFPLLSLLAGYPPADLELTKGKFLIATEKLMDPRFQQSVILMVQCDNDGAMGLILNHPTEMKAGDALTDIPELKRTSELIHIGGPVGMSSMMFLFRSTEDIEDSVRVFDHVYFGAGKEALQQRIKNAGSSDRYRIYAGYAGWTARQLEGEIQTGHWFVWHADAEIIFEKTAKDIWPEMIRRTSVIQARLNPVRASLTKSNTFR